MKTIVITGAASGLGKAIAHHYNQQNWTVIIADIQDELGAEVVAELNEKGPADAKSYYFHCDISHVADFEALARFTEETTGQCNILVNNAGIASTGTLMESDEDEWERMIRLDLMSCVRGSKAFIPLLKKSATEESPNAIVSTASFAGIALMPGMMSYNVTKAGVIAFTKTLRDELKYDHIHVAAACPSFFKTNLTDSMTNVDSETIARVNRWMEQSALSAESVAKDIAEGVENKTTVIISDVHMKGPVAEIGKMYDALFPKKYAP